MTPKQQRFVEEYLVDLNATQAAIRAGYSEKTAAEQACRLLINVKVADAIAEAQAERSERLKITKDMVLVELAKLAFANAGDYFTWGPDGVTLIAKTELTPDQWAAVAEVSETKTERGGTIRLKLYDKRGPLVDIGKDLGMFVDKQEVTGELVIKWQQ